MPVQQPAKKPRGKGVKIALGVIVGLVGLVCLGGVASAMSGGNNSKTTPDRSLEASAMCETFVKQKLKAPATAKFSGESTVKMSASEYTIAGSVDAQNSLGALLRKNFTCDLTYDATKQEWTSKMVSVSS